VVVLVTILVYEMKSQPLLVLATLFFAAFFLFFGRKLDEIPIIVTQNQLRDTEENTDCK
jgi:hypothetical protein